MFFKELVIQLFATTHSNDCIEAYVEAINELKDISNDVRVIKLKETNDKNIKAITYPFNEFGYLVESDSEIR
jgi:AAA15 family ATPase/GTPase